MVSKLDDDVPITFRSTRRVRKIWKEGFIAPQWRKRVMTVLIPALAKAVKEYGSGKFHTDLFQMKEKKKKLVIKLEFKDVED